MPHPPIAPRPAAATANLAAGRSPVTFTPLVRVVFWMTGALLAFSLMAVAVRVLARTLSIPEILAVRSGTGLLVMLAMLAAMPTLRLAIRTRRPGLNVFRNLVHLAGQMMWAKSILLLPLATVFALEFTAPAWTLLLAVPILGEQLTRSRIGAVVLGLIGILVIMRPGTAMFQPAALLVLTAAFAFASTMIMTKQLTATDTTIGIIFWMNAIQFPLTMLASDPLFVTKIGFDQWPAFAAVGVTGLLSHYCLTNAFRAADASVVVPMDFMRIPVIALVGWWLYNEKIDIFVFIGAGLIISGVLWNLRAEAIRARAAPRADAAHTAAE
ncbi:MAG: DMT family transporter [Xanthobacteraceae bacterium]